MPAPTLLSPRCPRLRAGRWVAFAGLAVAWSLGATASIAAPATGAKHDAVAPALPAAALRPPKGHPVPDPGVDGLSGFISARGLAGPPVRATGVPPDLADRMRVGASDLVIAAMNFIGVPYRLGGNDAAEGFDCSGFTRHVFEQALGHALPRRAEEQARADGLERVPRGDLQPGDLVFFNTLRRSFSHVGIYIGDGRFIHAPRSGAQIRIDDMRYAYWAQRYTGARRVAPSESGSAPAPGDI